LEGFAVFSVFLHVIFAILASILWVVGLALLVTMVRRGINGDIVKIVSVVFIVAGISFVLMEVFGSLAYSVYNVKVRETLLGNLPFFAFLFDLKLLLTALATFTGLLTVGLTLTHRTYKEAYLSVALASTTLVLFGICALLAIFVMTTISI